MKYRYKVCNAKHLPSISFIAQYYPLATVLALSKQKYPTTIQLICDVLKPYLRFFKEKHWPGLCLLCVKCPRKFCLDVSVDSGDYLENHAEPSEEMLTRPWSH